MSAHSPILQDQENWRHYLEPRERLLGTWRPDDVFRPYGIGKSLMFGSVVFVLLFGLANLFLIEGQTTRPVTITGLIILAFGLIAGLGPAKLDQINRRKRRFAITDRRALEFQDIVAGRLKWVALSGRLQVAKIKNENLECFEVGFVEMPEMEDDPHRTVHFQRLTEAQADEVLATLGADALSRIRRRDLP